MDAKELSFSELSQVNGGTGDDGGRYRVTVHANGFANYVGNYSSVDEAKAAGDSACRQYSIENADSAFWFYIRDFEDVAPADGYVPPIYKSGNYINGLPE